MNYHTIYENFIQSRKKLSRTNTKFSGFETHHILPRSLGGLDSPENLVILTPREHFFAHLLLTKINYGKNKAKMIHALRCLKSLRNNKRTICNSLDYEKAKIAYNKLRNSPEYKKYRSDIAKLQWTPERRKAVSEKTKEQWKTGVKRQVFSSKEYRDLKSDQMKKRWADPTYYKEMSDLAKLQWKDPNKRPVKS
jgi:hypothetical protein